MASITIPVAKTSLWIAAARYKETLRPDKLIDDPLAKVLLGNQFQETIDEMKKMFTSRSPETQPNQSQRRKMAIRTRWAQDIIHDCIFNKGITQIVNPACGLDTYAWRIPMPSNVTYYEIDFPEVMQYKTNTLVSYPIVCNYKPLSADLNLNCNWPELLLANGFDKTKPTLWLTMGFLVYLKEENVHIFLDRVNDLSAEGSFYTSDITHSLGAVAEIMKANGSPAQFTTTDPEGLFAKHGFTKVLQYLTYNEFAETLGIELEVPQMKKPVKKEKRIVFDIGAKINVNND